MNSAYEPMEPARRPGGKPEEKPCYRVLVHRKYESAWEQIVERVGIQQAQQFWDHVAKTPGMKDPIASTRPLKGKAGAPKEKGFSKTIHYELSSMARIDYQYCDSYRTKTDGDAHKDVFILAIDYSSH